MLLLFGNEQGDQKSRKRPDFAGNGAITPEIRGKSHMYGILSAFALSNLARCNL